MTAKQTDERIARLEEAITALTALAAPAPSPATVNPDGTPGHVAPGELIESAWGNAVSDSIGYLWPRQARRFIVSNNIQNTLPSGPEWGRVQIGQIDLPGVPGSVSWDLLVHVAGTIQDLDASTASFMGGYNGNRLTQSVATTRTPGSPGGGAHVTAAFIVTLPTGSYMIDAYGQTVVDGWLANCYATVLALPHVG